MCGGAEALTCEDRVIISAYLFSLPPGRYIYMYFGVSTEYTPYTHWSYLPAMVI